MLNELIKNYKETQESSDYDLILENKEMVHIAKYLYTNSQKYSLSWQEYTSIFHESILRCLESFDPEKGKFGTYVCYYFRYYRSNSIYQDKFQISLPSNSQQYMAKLGKHLEDPNITDAELSGICKPYNISPQRLRNIKNVLDYENHHNTTILDNNFSVEEEEKHYKINPDDIFEIAKKILNDRELLVLHFRIMEKKKLKDMSKILGITLQRVSQIENRVISKLKEEYKQEKF